MQSLSELLKTTEPSRDDAWEDLFLTALAATKVKVLSPDPQTGPDQWPYIMVDTTVEEEPTQKVLAWLAEKGIGMVVNPMKEFPDFVLSYGMIWSFRETGRFIDRRVTAPNGDVEYTSANLKIAGPPTEAYLPGYVRQILREFFRDQSVLQAKVLVVSIDADNYDFVFSLESLGNPPASEHEGIAEAISWFLPPHYNVVVASEKSLPLFSVL